ncbi:MAG: helix-turn-helix domain-containing protein [Candidatus Pristimantibacillus lignocellulolyticus]|uniref:Helix-turn-helix domain-containing protein n=1 Tax=Candidatus Pristimantibacillus lignocellulolyticus TaxID=2994561 RepID=A0A9J6ZEQ2_9BACL|nr:MAG: helix-turn-helix domain-containing protein [Candidatus Pristimantibacillus lignocellulolyticus]
MDMKISVKAARINKKMKASDAAKILGISDNTYSRKENGRNRFYADELARLSQAFEIPLEIFFETECQVFDTNNNSI